MWRVPGMGAHGWVAGIFPSHGDRFLSRGWLATVEAPGYPRHPPSTWARQLVNLFCRFFNGGVMGCGEQVTNLLCFLQSSFALHSLDFELSRISLRVSLDSLLYYLFLRQSSITVHVRRSTHLLFMISWRTFHSPEGFARNTTSRAWGKWLTSHKLHGWGGWVVALWTWLSRDSVQAPCNS